MGCINRVALSGNLTRDAELRYTNAGTGVLNFCIAVNENRKNAAGEWIEAVNYVNCVLWGKRAEALEERLTKGKHVMIEGRLHQSTWERDGQKRSSLEVFVDELDGLQRQSGQQADYEADYYDDDMPF